MMNKTFLLFLFLGGLIVPLASRDVCGDDGGAGWTERTRILMDTVVRIEAFGSDGEKVDEAIEAAFDKIEKLCAVLSLHDPESEVARLNRRAGAAPAAVSSDLLTVIENSQRYSVWTEGAFDVTVGAISRLWDFTGPRQQVPDTGEVSARLDEVDYRKLIVADDGQVGLARPGMVVDLGGVGKGYAVDQALEVLRERGIHTALVDAGGDIGILGGKPTGTAWRIGVQHPRDEQGMIAVLEVDSGSVATSGDYQRFIMKDGRRYHHIIDPKTGWPSSACLSVTIVAEKAMVADALATGVFVLGPDMGMRLLDRLCGVGGIIFFEKDGQIEHVLSAGLKDRVTFYP